MPYPDLSVCPFHATTKAPAAAPTLGDLCSLAVSESTRKGGPSGGPLGSDVRGRRVDAEHPAEGRARAVIAAPDDGVVQAVLPVRGPHHDKAAVGGGRDSRMLPEEGPGQERVGVHTELRPDRDSRRSEPLR